MTIHFIFQAEHFAIAKESAPEDFVPNSAGTKKKNYSWHQCERRKHIKNLQRIIKMEQLVKRNFSKCQTFLSIVLCL